MEENIDLRKEIAKVAYNIYEKRGGLQGSDLDDWLQAEKIVMQSYKTKSEIEGIKPAKSKGRPKKKEQKSRAAKS